MQKYVKHEQVAAKGLQVGKLFRRLLALLLIGGVVAAIVYASMSPAVQKQLGGSGRRAKMAANTPVPVVSAQARLADVPLYLEGVGTAKARNTVTVRAQIDGRILSVNFKEGQDVKKGDVLAKIDPSTYQAQLDQAVAKKALDQAQLANAQRDLERYTSLGGNIIAQKTIDTQRALVDQLTAQIKVDDAAIANAQAFLNYTTILAPIDGRTGLRLVDVGNLVRGSDAAQGIVVITELKPISVLFTLPQQQLGQVNRALSAGAVTVEALAADGRTAVDRGTLQVVDNQVDQSTGTIRMKAEFDNADLQLWPGQFVNVRVLVDTLKQVVVVPTPAVQRGPNGTFAYVVQSEDKVALRPITVSHQTETLAVISKGIDGSERVVTTGFARLKDGASISLAEPETAAPDGQAKSSSNTGADARPSLRASCAGDVQKFCASVADGGRSAIRDCLRANADKLSEACRSAAMREGKGGKRGDTSKAQGTTTE